MWDLYRVQPSFVLGFHGCDEETAERVLAGEEPLKDSRNAYDWLGNGIYFWESSPQRALEWASHVRDNPKSSRGVISKPAVVGAIIDLGTCCSLHDTAVLAGLAEAYQVLELSHAESNTPMPVNTGTEDLFTRYLDCAVIQLAHKLRAAGRLKAYDTVRAAFVEGKPLYTGAGMRSRSHVQIAVRNIDCIKGYFRPIKR